MQEKNCLADVEKKHHEKIPEQAHAYPDFNAILNAGRWTQDIVVQGESIKQQLKMRTYSKRTYLNAAGQARDTMLNRTKNSDYIRSYHWMTV